MPSLNTNAHNKRGTAERWIKEGKPAVKMTRLSCHQFRSNEVRLWLGAISYNLGNLWRRLVKTAGRLVKHARYHWRLLAESHLTRRLFGSMLRRMEGCRCPPGRRGSKAKPIWTTEGNCWGKCPSNGFEIRHVVAFWF